MRGLPVSAGIYEGRARVVLDAEGLASVRKGEVLVARSTSTAFNYVLPLWARSSLTAEDSCRMPPSWRASTGCPA